MGTIYIKECTVRIIGWMNGWREKEWKKTVANHRRIGKKVLATESVKSSFIGWYNILSGIRNVLIIPIVGNFN
jgi:hypothetical protein